MTTCFGEQIEMVQEVASVLLRTMHKRFLTCKMSAEYRPTKHWPTVGLWWLARRTAGSMVEVVLHACLSGIWCALSVLCTILPNQHLFMRCTRRPFFALQTMHYAQQYYNVQVS